MAGCAAPAAGRVMAPEVGNAVARGGAASVVVQGASRAARGGRSMAAVRVGAAVA